LTADLLEKFEPEIESITLIPSSGGVYEITVNNELIYSKKTIGRHAEPGEVLGLLEKFIKEGQK
jgi:selenoprotein W-related protein